MFVLSFLYQIEIHLIAYEQLVTAVAGAYRRCVELVAVAEHHSVEHASEHECHRVGGAVANASVHHFLVVGVYQPACDVGSPGNSVGAYERRRFYC